MPENPIRNYIQQLQHLNLLLRLHLEEAEVRIPEINNLIGQLLTIELIPETALLGLVIYERHYSALTGPHDSSQVLQSALLIPGGLGVILWDCEDYLRFQIAPAVDQGELFLKFVPFDQCGSAVKVLLLPQIEPLMELLVHENSVKRLGELNNTSERCPAKSLFSCFLTSPQHNLPQKGQD